MKLNILGLVFLFLLSSCGALRLSPTGCHGLGIWGDQNAEGRYANELKFTETYYVWNMDYEVRLKDFLKVRNIECNQIKKIHINITSVFFVKRELTVFIQK